MTETPLPQEPAAGLPIAVVVAATDGRICYWSAGAEDLTGHLAAAAVGQPLDLIVPPDYRQRHWAGLRAAMASGTARFEGGSTNIPVLCADGAVWRWPGRFTLLRDARGKPAGAAAVLVVPADGDPPLFDLQIRRSIGDSRLGHVRGLGQHWHGASRRHRLDFQQVWEYRRFK